MFGSDFFTWASPRSGKTVRARIYSVLSFSRTWHLGGKLSQFISYLALSYFCIFGQQVLKLFPARKERQLFAKWCKLSRARFGQLLFPSQVFGHFEFSNIVCFSRLYLIWKNYRVQKMQLITTMLCVDFSNIQSSLARTHC